MTADIRTAAQREAAERFHWLNRDAKITSITAFVSGAEWAHRVTPTREQLIERVSGKYFAEHLPGVGEHTEVSVPLATSIADIVLDFIEDLAEGGLQ